MKTRRSRNELRTRFQRHLWAVVFLAGYLLASLKIFDYVDEADGSSSVLMLLIGAFCVTMVGAWIAPYIPAALGVMPTRPIVSRRLKKK